MFNQAIVLRQVRTLYTPYIQSISKVLRMFGVKSLKLSQLVPGKLDRLSLC